MSDHGIGVPRGGTPQRPGQTRRVPGPTDHGLGPIRLAAFFAVFVTFGAVFGLIGPAWVGMGPDLGLEPSALPLITVPLILGRMLGALVAPRLGRATSRRHRLLATPVALGAGQLLVASGLDPADGLAAPMVGLAVTGFAGGVLDVTVNDVLAERGAVRDATLVHGGYGVGAIGGPLLLAVGLDWRAAFVIGGGAAIAAATVAPIGARTEPGDVVVTPSSHTPSGPEDAVPPGAGAARVPILWGLTLAAGLIGAVEILSAQWVPTVLSETAGWSESRAGAIGAVFWAVLTAVRLLVGLSPWRPDLVDGAAIRWVAVLGGLFVTIGGTPAAAGAVLIAAGVSTGLPFLVVEAGRRSGPAGISAALVSAAVVSAAGLAVLGPIVEATSVRAAGVAIMVAGVAAMALWPDRAPTAPRPGPEGELVEG